MSDTKPLFIIKKNLQKSKQTNVYFDQVLTNDVLKDICKKIFQTTDFDVNFVDNKYEDDCLQRGYNIGRLAYLHYKDEIHYITFSEQNPGGRDSSVQSVPPAFERFLTYQINQKRKRCTFHYYFFPGAIQKITEYQKFMYRLMKSSGVHFLNGDSLKIKPFLLMFTKEAFTRILLNRMLPHSLGFLFHPDFYIHRLLSTRMKSHFYIELRNLFQTQPVSPLSLLVHMLR